MPKRSYGILRASIGTVFSVDESGVPLKRAFGGQTHRQTYYCGTSTGRQIVSALVMEVRRFESAGLIHRRLRTWFHSALIKDGVCYGALLFDDGSRALKYGPQGKQMTRDVISREIDAAPSPVMLDVSFPNRKMIDERLPEVYALCERYGEIDIHTDPIPVEPSVHFFMGGLAVHSNHETNIRGLFAVGE